MILIIDNRDSFVFNIARYFEELGQSVCVVDSHVTTIRDIEHQAPRAIIISPGPCAPDQAGISLDAIETFAGRLPILGVCLGHQAIGMAFGAEVVHATTPRHGLSSDIQHSGDDIFEGLPNPLQVGLYHSLAIKSVDGTPLRAQAWSADGDIMALRHRDLPVFGVQFHPESVLSEHGHQLFRNFLKETKVCPV